MVYWGSGLQVLVRRCSFLICLTARPSPMLGQDFSGGWEGPRSPHHSFDVPQWNWFPVQEKIHHFEQRYDEKLRLLEQRLDNELGVRQQPMASFAPHGPKAQELEKGVSEVSGRLASPMGSIWSMGLHEEVSVHIEKSVWEAVVAVGTGKIGFAASAVIFLGVVINTVLQVMLLLDRARRL